MKANWISIEIQFPLPNSRHCKELLTSFAIINRIFGIFLLFSVRKGFWILRTNFSREGATWTSAEQQKKCLKNIRSDGNLINLFCALLSAFFLQKQKWCWGEKQTMRKQGIARCQRVMLSSFERSSGQIQFYKFYLSGWRLFNVCTIFLNTRRLRS